MRDQETAARATRRDYCRGCSAKTLHPFAGWATPHGRENTIRPRAYYRSCSRCGIVVMVLADATDAEGLARYVLEEHLRPRGGTATATEPPTGPVGTDWDTVLNYLVETCWRLYSERWNPAVGVTFRSYAIGIMRQRLPRFVGDERGEPNKKGRVNPKAHAPSISTSLDGLLEGEDGDEGRGAVEGRTDDRGSLAAALPGRTGDFADDRSPDLAWALTPRSRSNARP